MNQLHHACRLSLCGASLLLFVACGDRSTPTNTDSAGESSAATSTSAKQPATSDGGAVTATTGSGVGRFAGDSVCDILPAAALQEKFGAPADLAGEPIKSRGLTGCSYSWPRPDAQERKEAMVEQMMKKMQSGGGDKSPLDVRAMSTDYTVDILLGQSGATSGNFVPEKLSEEDLQKRIDQAAEAANKRLTAEQKEVLGKNGAGDMVGNMLRKTNERVAVEGLGEAAYWMPMMGGSLHVLANGYKVEITPNLADSDDDNFKAARHVAEVVLR